MRIIYSRHIYKNLPTFTVAYSFSVRKNSQLAVVCGTITRVSQGNIDRNVMRYEKRPEQTKRNGWRDSARNREILWRI